MPEHSEVLEIPSGRARLSVVRAGAGGAPHVVFLHTGISDKRSWDEVLGSSLPRHGRRGLRPAWLRRHHVPGRGATTSWSICGRPRRAGAGPGRPGRQLPRWPDRARLHPDPPRTRVAALVLVAPAVSGAPAVDDAQIDPVEAAIWETLAAADAAGALDALNLGEIRLWVDGPHAPEGRVGGTRRELALDMNRIALHAESPGHEPAPPLEAWSRLSEVRCPVLVVVGDLDLGHIQERVPRAGVADPGRAPRRHGGCRPPPRSRAAGGVRRAPPRLPERSRAERAPREPPIGVPPVVWRDVLPARGRSPARHRRGRSPGNVDRILGRARRRPKRRERTSASCPSWPYPATRPRTSSSSRPSWRTTSPRWRRSPPRAGSAPSWSATSGRIPTGPGLSNAAAICAGGRVVGTYRKRCLPNYGVFDEQRWFVPSTETPTLFGVAGAWVGISVCEDVWFPDGPVAEQGRRRGRRGGQPQCVALQPGTPAASGSPCCARGWPRPDVPSPTSTRSAARTSWSSTATPSLWRPTARSWPAGPSSPPTWWWWTSPSRGCGYATAPDEALPRVVATDPRAERPCGRPAPLRPALRPDALRRGRGLCRTGSRDP